MIKRNKTHHKPPTFYPIYRFIHIVSVIYGLPTLLIANIGVIIFFHDPSFRLNQLGGMIVSIMASIALLIPVHKTHDDQRLTTIYYLVTTITALTTGLLAYPIYFISFILLLTKLMITTLRLFSMLKVQGKNTQIHILLVKNIAILMLVAFLSTQGMRWLANSYDRKIPIPDYTASNPSEIIKAPPIPLSELGFAIPGTPTRIWRTVTIPHITIIDTLVPGKGGDYSTLFLYDEQNPTELAKVSIVEFNNGNNSIGKFGTPTISPDLKYLFISESGYEGGFTHAFSIESGKSLPNGSYPSGIGTMHWSEGGTCILGELYEYGDQQALQLGVENGNGYTMYPYEQSIRTVMGIEELSIFWFKEPQCTVLLTFTAGMMINPSSVGEYTDQELIFDMKSGPIKRNRWVPLYNFERSQKPATILQIYP